MARKTDPTKTARNGTAAGRKPFSTKTLKSEKGRRDVTLPMTEAMERFVLYYMARRSATRAYKDAHPGCADSTASTSGSVYLRDPRIKAVLTRLLEEERERLTVNAQKVGDHLAAIAFTSLADVYTASGTMIPPVDLPRETAMAVKRLKRREIFSPDGVVIGHTIEVEMYDKIAALRLLGLEHQMFVEKTEHVADDALLAALRDARERSLRET
jgi:hypothetical protein